MEDNLHLKICLLLSDPKRPAITEIYGKFLPKKGHNIIWITNKKDSYNLEKMDIERIELHEICDQKYSSIFIKRYFNSFKYYLKLLNKVDSIFKNEK